MSSTVYLFFLHCQKLFCYQVIKCEEVLRTNSSPERMKTFVAFYLFEQFRVFSISEEFLIDFWETGPSLKAAWGGNGIDAASRRRGRESGEQESGGRVDMYWLRAETAHDSLSKGEIPTTQPLWGMSSFRWDSSPEKVSIFGIQHFLISLGWYKYEPPPPFDLHSPLNEVIAKGCL